MHKSLLVDLSDEKFTKFVNTSHSLNELAKNIGYRYSPGQNTKVKIKKRMIELNLSFKEKRSNMNATKNIVNLSHLNTKDIGDIGETHFQLECLKRGMTVSKVVGDNKPYEYVMDINNTLYRVQVKTSSQSFEDKVIFDTTSTVRTSTGYFSKKYSNDEVDYFYLYDIALDKGFLMKVKNQSSIILRYKQTSNNQIKRVNYADDFTINVILSNLLKED